MGGEERGSATADPTRRGVEDCGGRTLPPVPSASSLAARPGVTEGRRTGLPGGRAADEVAAAAGSAADEVAAKAASASMADEVAAAAASATTVNEAAAMGEAEMSTPDALLFHNHCCF